MSENTESTIREAFDRDDLERAATVALESYGPEVIGYLAATLRDDTAASEVFSQTSEDLWRGLADFEWRCSFRTWFYCLARHAAARYRKAPPNQARRRRPLSEISEVAARVRTRTLPFLRTDVKDRFATLRESLSRDDQSLLILRVDRELSWNDVSRVVAADPDLDEAELQRVAARLRKRFQTVKDRLRELAIRDGLLRPDA